MMGKILTEIKTTEKGLVGITFDGKEISIKKQGSNINRIKMNILNPSKEEYSEWINEQMQDISRGYLNGTLIQLKEIDPFGDIKSKKNVVFLYNLYRPIG